MHKQAHGRHAKEKKLAVSMPQSMLSFLIPQLVILDNLLNLKNVTTYPWQIGFCAPLCNKRAIVHKGIGI